jgi:hypothetical protein
MADIEPGYIGISDVDGTLFRCTDFNVNANQDFEFYNHTIGLNDTIPADDATKGEDIGVHQTQRTFVRPGRWSLGGSVSFPATNDTATVSKFFESIKTGSVIDALTMWYYCKNGRTYKDCRTDSFTLDVTAGDIVNVTAGVKAKTFDENGGDQPSFQVAQKLVTWDEFDISVAGAAFDDSLIKSFSLAVNNNAQEIYTLDPDNDQSELGPHDIRLGMQEVSGTITIYLRDGDVLLPDCVDPAVPTVINIGFAGWNTNINVLFLPIKSSAAIGPVTTTIGFVGIDKAFD